MLKKEDEYSEQVKKKIQNSDAWYVDSQFKWAKTECVKRIYRDRWILFRNILKKELGKKRHVRLLDCGCGDGYWASFFTRFPSCHVTAIDYNALRLERARAVASKAQFLEGDLNFFNRQLGKFDIVFCSQVIEHVRDDLHLLEVLKKYLNDSGIMVLGTTNEGCVTQRFRNILKKEKTDHVHFYTELEISGKLQQAGFNITGIHREVLYPGFDEIYYYLTSKVIGYELLKALTKLLPSQCSDYYFVCETSNFGSASKPQKL